MALHVRNASLFADEGGIGFSLEAREGVPEDADPAVVIPEVRTMIKTWLGLVEP